MTNIKESVDFRKIREELYTSTRNLWLASLGVVSTVSDEGTQWFDELVERGKKMETKSKKSLTKTRKDIEKEIESTTDELTEKLDKSVSDVLQRMGVPSRSQVEDLTDRVEKLTGQVERLVKQPRKPSTRKPKAA
jgi:poly(hydroxyalkanoate) granule-associated protein